MKKIIMTILITLSLMGCSKDTFSGIIAVGECAAHPRDCN